jgi:hypothetical protein
LSPWQMVTLCLKALADPIGKGPLWETSFASAGM